MNQKVYMTDQEFTAHMAALIPTPSEEADDSLLDLAHSLWFELKEDLCHTFSFISRHFTPETLQRVYDLCNGKDQGILPWELVGTAIYLQAGTPPQEISKQEWKGSKIFVRPSNGRGYTLADAFDVSQTQGREVWKPRLEDNTPEMECGCENILFDAPIVDAIRGIHIADFCDKGQAVYRPAQPVPPDAICRYRVFGHFLFLRKNASHGETH